MAFNNGDTKYLHMLMEQKTQHNKTNQLCNSIKYMSRHPVQETLHLMRKLKPEFQKTVKLVKLIYPATE